MGLDFFGGGVIPTEEAVSSGIMLCMSLIGPVENIFTDGFCYVCTKQLRLSSLENKAVNDMFVILSDVWLDSYEVFSLVLILVLYNYIV